MYVYVLRKYKFVIRKREVKINSTELDACRLYHPGNQKKSYIFYKLL